MAAVVEIENLVKRYHEIVALDHFRMYVNEGEILGLLGPNGSGKTTLINCMLSLLRYERGIVRLFGKEMGPEDYERKAQIGIVPQNISVVDELTVYENIDYFCGLYIQDKKIRKQYAEEAVEFVGLEGYEGSYPSRLSGGLQRRLNIACGIAHKPKLIIFDEPMVAVDPQSRNKILEGITELNRGGAAIIYTSHYMEEVERLCSRVIIMDKGRNIAEGTKEKLKRMLKNKETISVEIPNFERERLRELKELPCAYEALYENGRIKVKFSGGTHNLIHILDYLQRNQILFGQVMSEQPTLNDVFLEITGNQAVSLRQGGPW